MNGWVQLAQENDALPSDAAASADPPESNSIPVGRRLRAKRFVGA
jgi:hypothetical protein